MFRAAVADLKGLRDIEYQTGPDDGVYRPIRSRFLQCTSRDRQKAAGYGLLTDEGAGMLGIHANKCGRPECPSCRDSKAKNETSERLAALTYLHEEHGLQRVWTLVFTVPDSVAGNVGNARKLLDATRDTIRDYWKGHKPGIVLDEHLTGDQDPTKTRLHVHALVVPMEHGNGTWNSLDDGQPLDLIRLRNLWAKRLRKQGLVGTNEEPINPEARYFSLAPGAIGKLQHRMSYDGRGFGEDIKRAVLWSVKDDAKNNGMRLVLRKTEKRWVKGKRRRYVATVGHSLTTVGEWAERWLWLVKNTPKTRVYGFLRRYPEDLREHLEKPLELHMHWTGEQKAGRIIRERYKHFDKTKGYVVGIRRDYFQSEVRQPREDGIGSEILLDGPPVLIDGLNIVYLTGGIVKRLRDERAAGELQREAWELQQGRRELVGVLRSLRDERQRQHDEELARWEAIPLWQKIGVAEALRFDVPVPDWAVDMADHYPGMGCSMND